MRFINLIVVLLLLTGSVSAGPDLESQAKRLEGRLMAPCCMANTVAEHYSGAAFEMRQEIRDLLADGKTEDEILDYFVGKHGSLILARPAATGFNFLAYGVPIALFPLGALLLLVWLRRVRRATAPARPQQQFKPIERRYADRIKSDLHGLG